MKKNPALQPPDKSRYVLIGGFLGCGKTTAAARLGEYLKRNGRSVALITNDHGKNLVDTEVLRSHGFRTEEIPGGCFCGQFDSISEAAGHLAATARPEVIVAEPAGSCADLVATVFYPLRTFYGDRFTLAPLSVLVDPTRATQIFGLESGARFSEKIGYIYRKQLQEADLIVINKADSVSASKIARLQEVLEHHAQAATILKISARTGAGLEEWFERLLRSEHSERDAMEMDYHLYAEGEAMLGWLDCTVRLASRKYFDCSRVLTDLATCVQALLQQEGAEIAHLKMVLKPDEDLDGIALINLVRNDFVPELSQQLPEPIQSGELILNLRAEADPEILHAAVNRGLLALVEKSPDLFARMEHSDHFRPARPKPTHRIASLAQAAA